jgi:hypothetical protein
MICNLCNSAGQELFAQATVLGRHTVSYYRCVQCGFISTEQPFWLDEAYTAAINDSDVGLVQRNHQLATVVKVLIPLFFNPRGRFVDYAGGYGLLVRLMRDWGYDFTWYDKYCHNIFAGDFVAAPPGTEQVELLTAFEVFEHLSDPWSELERMLAYSRNILFTTQLLPEPAPKPDEWWYYGLEHGQHICIYTRRSLQCLAERAGLNYYTNGSSMHLFTEKRLSQKIFSLLSLYKVARFVAPFVGRPSLVAADFRSKTGLPLP